MAKYNAECFNTLSGVCEAFLNTQFFIFKRYDIPISVALWSWTVTADLRTAREGIYQDRNSHLGGIKPSHIKKLTVGQLVP